MILRLEEFESMLNMVESSAHRTNEFIKTMNNFKGEFKDICDKTDAFEALLNVIDGNTKDMEEHVKTAAQELGYSTKGLGGVFDSLFSDQKKPGEPEKTNLDGSGKYVPVEIFKAGDYFPDSSSC